MIKFKPPKQGIPVPTLQEAGEKLLTERKENKVDYFHQLAKENPTFLREVLASYSITERLFVLQELSNTDTGTGNPPLRDLMAMGLNSAIKEVLSACTPEERIQLMRDHLIAASYASQAIYRDCLGSLQEQERVTVLCFLQPKELSLFQKISFSERALRLTLELLSPPLRLDVLFSITASDASNFRKQPVIISALQFESKTLAVILDALSDEEILDLEKCLQSNKVDGWDKLDNYSLQERIYKAKKRVNREETLHDLSPYIQLINALDVLEDSESTVFQKEAARAESRDKIQTLLSSQVELHRVIREYSSVLPRALALFPELRLLDLLIKSGIEPEPLLTAVKVGNDSVVTHVLKALPPVERLSVIDPEGKSLTPLKEAFKQFRDIRNPRDLFLTILETLPEEQRITPLLTAWDTGDQADEGRYHYDCSILSLISIDDGYKVHDSGDTIFSKMLKVLPPFLRMRALLETDYHGVLHPIQGKTIFEGIILLSNHVYGLPESPFKAAQQKTEPLNVLLTTLSDEEKIELGTLLPPMAPSALNNQRLMDAIEAAKTRVNNTSLARPSQPAETVILAPRVNLIPEPSPKEPKPHKPEEEVLVRKDNIAPEPSSGPKTKKPNTHKLKPKLLAPKENEQTSLNKKTSSVVTSPSFILKVMNSQACTYTSGALLLASIACLTLLNLSTAGIVAVSLVTLGSATGIAYGMFFKRPKVPSLADPLHPLAESRLDC